MSQLDLIGGSSKKHKEVIRPSALAIYNDLKTGYRNTWKHGVKPNKDWIRTLNKLTDEELQIGYNKIGDFFPEWPPSHWSFEKLCKQRKARQIRLNQDFNSDRSKESDDLMKKLKADFK